MPALFFQTLLSGSKNPYDTVVWERRDARITNPKTGEVVFEMKGVEVPQHWSQTATDIVASKYFRKAGVPQSPLRVSRDALSSETGIPSANIIESTRRGDAVWRDSRTNDVITGPERSVRDVIGRMADCWRHWGSACGYFETKEDARAFAREVTYMMLHQMAAPNSPQWFNTGLFHVYGIEREAHGHWYCDEQGKAIESNTCYERPQVAACFIQSVNDNLVRDGGIFDVLSKEAHIFKFGSGTGSNFSTLRAHGEPLSAGGSSSGLMSWLKINDVAAGAIKSGGTTRRAAKMVVLDMDHPDIEAFIDWKHREELKVRALVEGHRVLRANDPEYDERASATGLDLDYDFNGDAYATVSGQHANNSVRVTDEFMRAVDADADWELRRRTDGAVAKTVPARHLWDKLVKSAWACADPGIQFDTTINDWHTCPNDGRQRASNPCSEFLWLDNSACNLASLNLVKFYKGNREFDFVNFQHAVRVWTTVLDISVSMMSLPSKKIAEGMWKHRTLGLGYANLGALLMRMGLSYASEEARTVASSLTSIMTGTAYVQSAQMAQALSPFPQYAMNQEAMLRVIDNHAACANGTKPEGMGSSVYMLPVDRSGTWMDAYLNEACTVWDDAQANGRDYGFRNAQVTVIAPTGTIGLLMDCDTTGIEPDFALVKFKKLAGGGTMQIVNQSVEPALLALGYDRKDRESICEWIKSEGTIEGASAIRLRDLPVFDCAVAAGGDGRSIPWEAHVDMVGAVQPFVSGSVSKTINMPQSATVDDVESAYRRAHKHGLKCVALYRDKCKQSQPLNTKSREIKRQPEPTTPDITDALRERAVILGDGEPLRREPVRYRLPDTRDSVTHKFTVNGHEGYLTVGVYADGMPGELFVRMAKEGSTINGLMDAWAVSVSMLLQFGVPLETVVRKFKHQKFEPSGFTPNRDIKQAASLVDYVAKWLERRFLPSGQHTFGMGIEGGGNGNGNGHKPVDAAMFDVSGALTHRTPIDGHTALMESEPRLAGFGPPCRECGHGFTSVNGNCHVCPACGSNTGCGS